jgi:hypothetical protein
MAKASLVKELMVKTANTVGMMAEVSNAIAKSGANITALNAFGIDKNAIFRIVTSDNAKAISAIKEKNIGVSERDVVSVELANKPGIAAEMGEKLKGANIDITYIYGSTCGGDCSCTIIFNCSDNKKAVEVLSK